MSDLELIAELRIAIRQADDGAPFLLERLEKSLEGAPRYTRTERETLSNLKDAISNILLAKRQGLTPYTSSAGIYLSSIEGWLRKRTTGLAGGRAWLGELDPGTERAGPARKSSSLRTTARIRLT